MSASTSPSHAASKPAKGLRVGGVTPFSATDYPGKFSAVVFVQGCPWRCVYCHNPHLQPRAAPNPVDWARLRQFLARRVGLVDAVVFSGGEPTIDPCLESAIDEVRALGFLVGLHTACVYPARLGALLPKLDWVGFDVKAPFEHYHAITGADGGAGARACVEMILASGVDHECRTTTHPQLHTPELLDALSAELAAMGVRNYALQLYRDHGRPEARLGRVPHGFPGNTTLQHIASRFERFSLREA